MKKPSGRNRKSASQRAETGARNLETENRGNLPHMFDIPASAIAGTAHIELAGNREAVVDGCQGVLEYDENVIKLSTGKMVVKFAGRALQIKVLTHDSAVIGGFITHMEFIT